MGWILIGALTLVMLVLVITAWLRRKGRPLSHGSKPIPLLSVGYNPLLGHLKLVLSDQANGPKKRLAPFSMMYQDTKQPLFDLVFGPALFGKRVTVINDSYLAEKVLTEKYCGMHPSFESAFSYTVGRSSLVVKNGETWRRHRRFLQPKFRQDCFVNLTVTATCNRTRTALDKLEDQITAGRGCCTLEVQQLIADLMFDITGETFFGFDNSKQRNENTRHLIRESFDTIMDCMSEIYLFSSLWMWRLVRRKKDVELQKARSVIIEQVLKPTLKARQGAVARGEAVPSDLPTLFMSDDDDNTEGNGSLQEQEIINELMSLYIAGFDTTTTVISWALYFLAQHEAVQAKLRQEVSSILGLQGFENDVTVAEVEQLNFARCVVKETMRLQPSVPLIGRGTTKDIVIDGYLIPKGRPVFIHTQNIHCSEQEYDDADVFKPTRWSVPGGGCKKSPGYSFLTFGGGKRRCVAMRFAMRQVTLVLAMIVHRFSLKLVALPEDVEAVYKATWAPKRLDITFKLPA